MSLFGYEALAVMTLLMIGLDLFQTRGGQITIKKAAIWSVFWFALAIAFNFVIYAYWDQVAPDSTYHAKEAGTAFLTGYLLEKSLSVDNLFVFALLFTQFAVPSELRPRVLTWGILGALILRAIMIGVGAELLETFHWILYVFGGFLIYTGYKLWREEEEDEHNDGPSLPERLVRKIMPVLPDYDGHKLVVRRDHKLFATPLLVVVVVIAFTDVMFALDSIPAIFAVTREPYLVLTANVFALLGLRSLYFVLEGMLDRFCYLRPALAFILTFIGIKMLMSHTAYAIPTLVSLAVIVVTITVAISASLWVTRKQEKNAKVQEEKQA
ncbi:Putative membrane-bound redox modulator Alx [Vibrio stylophorae]|uniref:Membrane-bound redox modulator Alx n=1 Tax=Vibrio stylophorae TaxID=659351 RepID=A0ABN8DY47_9VIBR|nr:TerC family protein [Vibrio stylophorae]CAH0535739.1 Putative membrane-bound redox modulator Alx [Vibrio stylophorae]